MYSKLFRHICIEYKYVNISLTIMFSILMLLPIFLSIPNNTTNKFYKIIRPPNCVVKSTTGHYCSTCGLTRSIIALYSGNIQKSKAYHPLGIFVSIWLFFEFIFRFPIYFFKSYFIVLIDIFQFTFFIILFKITISF